MSECNKSFTSDLTFVPLRAPSEKAVSNPSFDVSQNLGNDDNDVSTLTIATGQRRSDTIATHEGLVQAALRELPWYNWWVKEQVKEQPKHLHAFLSEPNDKSTSLLYGVSDHSFSRLWASVARCLAGPHDVSIDDIVNSIIAAEGLHYPNESRALQNAKQLVFSIIGWQTMLYRSDVLSGPISQFCILDETDGHRCQAQLCLKQNLDTSKQRIPDFLMGFGVMLPPPNYCACEATEDRNTFEQLASIEAVSFNAHLLVSIGKIETRWVDTLTCHMEFDVDTRSLYLFRYPSFCAVHLQTEGCCDPERSAIHSCARVQNMYSTWATTEDVTQLLNEILLSYRLLFGQDRKSRRLFRKLKPFSDVPAIGRDSMLSELCSHAVIEAATVRQRNVYRMQRDFPILRSRIARLVTHLEAKRPRTWRELWVDRRDSASWLTLWVVLIIGGIGIMLSVVQVITQIVQLSRQP